MHLARGLAARGVRVALFTYAVPGLPRVVDGIEIVGQRRPDWSFGPARRIVVFGSTVIGLLTLRARAVVQRAAGAATGTAAITSRLTRTRFVFSSASTLDFSFEDYGHGRATNALYHLGVRLADEVVVQTDEQAELCRARFGRDPVVIRSVAEPADGPIPGAETEGFLWIGRLVDYKNPRAFVDLAEALPEAPFTMVCVPAEQEGAIPLAELEARAADLPNLTLLGPQSRPAMLERIARATAIVTTSDFEGMPNTLIEGWSRGVPAISLAHDPDGMIVRESLGTWAAGDAARIVADARAAWEGREGDAELRERCRAYVRREHHPDAVLARWKAVLRTP